MKPKVLAISPHLDDAIFSVGGLLYKASRKGWDCQITTCFTKSVLNPKGFALACQTDKDLSPDADYMKIRRMEDAKACHLLGVRHQWLSFKEAPHRGYQNPKMLFQDCFLNDSVYIDLSKKLLEMYTEFRPDIILFPAGIGNHVDHQQVRKAVELLKAEISKGSAKNGIRAISSPTNPSDPDSSPTRLSDPDSSPIRPSDPDSSPTRLFDQKITSRPRFYEWFDEPYYSKLINSDEFADQTARFSSAESIVRAGKYQIDITDVFPQKTKACSAYATQFDFQFKSTETFHRIFSRPAENGAKKCTERIVRNSN